MSAPVCPDCGGDRLHISRGTGTVPIYVYCAAWNCHWTQEPAQDLTILAALETYKRNQPKEAA